MAAFNQDFTIEQSDDCSTLTLQDNSNFGNNTEGYNFNSFTTKQFVIYDFAGTVLATIPIVDATPVTFTLTKDMYLSIVYILQSGVSAPLTKTYNIALSCFVDLKYGTIVAKDYNNNNAASDDSTSRLFNIMKGIKSAQIFASVGNGTLSQDMLDYANSYTNTFINTP